MQTTDPQDEVFDVVDERDVVVGTATRAQVHADPSLIHRSVGILVRRSDGRTFLQLRSATKDTFPGYWTCSATGHVDKGETYEQAAVRELREELGIEVNAPLVPIVTTIIRYPHETEMMRFYMCETDAPVAAHPVEVAGGTLVDFSKPLPADMRVTPCAAFIHDHLLSRG